MIATYVLRIYIVLHIVAIGITLAFGGFVGIEAATCDDAPSWACGSPLEGITGAIGNLNINNPLSVFGLIPGFLKSIYQLMILDYAWLPTDGILSIPVYAVRVISAIIMVKAAWELAKSAGGALGGALGRFI